MSTGFDLYDNYCWTKEKKIITKDVHHVPGLGNFSHFNFNEGHPPSPMHYHSNIIEIHCIVRGTRRTFMEEDGQIFQYHTTGNQAFISFPFELHGNGTKPQSPYEFYGLQIITSNPYNMLGLNREYSYALNKQLLGLKNHNIHLGQTHISQLCSAFNFFSESTPEAIMVGVQFLTCFLYNLQFLMPVTENTMTNIDPRIKLAMEFLHNNLCESLQLVDLADIAGYSLPHFKVKFKKELGITPSEYITMRKIEHAGELLKETDVSITQLAYDLGFSSSNYFDAVFKKLMICTPNEYRRQFRQKEKI